MKAVIIAGGRGTRMGKISDVLPKALIPISGKPLIDYQIFVLKKYRIKDILIVINHLGGKIKQYCGNGKRFGLKISYFEEQEPLGTAGAIKLIEKDLKEDFIVAYGDVLFNLDFNRLISFHKKNKKTSKNYIGTLVVHPNDHPFDSDLVEVNENGKILKFLPKPHPQGLVFRNLVNAAMYVLTPKIHEYIEKNKTSDFGKHIFPKVLKQKGVLFAYNTPEYLKDMGTSQRLKQVEAFVKSGKFAKGSLDFKKPAIFLDRDGVINKEVGDLRNIRDFKLLPKTAEAIKKINYSGYYAVVVTNQPVAAKGFCSYEDILNFHKKMETLLAQQGAKLDAIYFCPHHPDKGFPGENKKYKIVCSCRKPKIGMIRQASGDLNIDLKNSYFVGDSNRDAQAAKNAGIKFVGVRTGYGSKDVDFKQLNKSVKAVLKKDLLSAVLWIYSL